ncbi:hypothetical protein TVAG_071860 [Trichomonas vaginalis G3]|uniref:Uncharacterized protein n=1 Tax=Trichomonas vaginalis (strain ATCC PRA-98 / G3) TaxID=412133 RepID=A2D889_TRIV3|nr:spectrin binding [Trichomonas vaginalis G3]EAY23522.1 hypothetical protein TVAG_071860 [Trichomonas vaginalis G3]KAI5493944.1 spectrin binding [Trichomonas vaginalis G3]|eukprot:XP_001584508.1 hypothetical protein [Trichomonas vaginalis G3]
MSVDLYPDYEYIAAHINDYIEDGVIIDIFSEEDFKFYFNSAKLTPTNFIELLRQISSHFTKKDLNYSIPTFSISNSDEAISILEAVKKHMCLRFHDEIIDFIAKSSLEISDLKKKNSELENSIDKLQMDLKTIINQKKDCEREMIKHKMKVVEFEINLRRSANENIGSMSNTMLHRSNSMPMNENNKKLVEMIEQENLSKIVQLKKSNDFESIYLFFDKLSEQNNKKMLLVACKKGLWRKKSQNGGMNILHTSCTRGNLKLVKHLIRSGCNIESKTLNGNTPLIWAILGGNLKVVKYLISAGANKEAKTIYGLTPLIIAAGNNQLEIVKYLISIGVDVNAKTISGKTVLTAAESSENIRMYLRSIGIN